MAAGGGHWVKGSFAGPGEAVAFIPARLAGSVEVREIEARLEEQFAALRNPGITSTGERGIIRNEIRANRRELAGIIKGVRVTPRKKSVPAEPKTYPSWAKTDRQKKAWDAVKALRAKSGGSPSARYEAAQKAARLEREARFKRYKDPVGGISYGDVAAFRKGSGWGSGYTGD